MDWSNAVQRDRIVSYQARLNKKLESKIISMSDSAILNIGTPEDILLIEEVKDVNGDKISTISKGHIVTNVIFPVLKNIPVEIVEGKGTYALTSIVSAMGEGTDSGKEDKEDLTTVTVRLPLSANVKRGNKLVRVFVQEGKVNTIMVFDVINLLADYSTNAPIAVNAVLSLSKDTINASKEIYQKIIALANRRIAVGY